MNAVRKYRSAQTITLLYITGAYRTTSTAALAILAGIPLIYYTLTRDYNNHRVTRYKNIKI